MTDNNFAANVSVFRFISPLCIKCNGKYVHDGKPDLLSAKEEFRIIPNACIPAENGDLLCPYIKGYLK